MKNAMQALSDQLMAIASHVTSLAKHAKDQLIKIVYHVQLMDFPRSQHCQK